MQIKNRTTIFKEHKKSTQRLHKEYAKTSQRPKIKTTNCKCFTCVIKTIANLTKYSRKPGDYNGTIIFDIDIMKNSYPLNLIFTFFAMSKPK